MHVCTRKGAKGGVNRDEGGDGRAMRKVDELMGIMHI